jgi:hypothetical protein
MPASTTGADPRALRADIFRDSKTINRSGFTRHDAKEKSNDNDYHLIFQDFHAIRRAMAICLGNALARQRHEKGRRSALFWSTVDVSKNFYIAAISASPNSEHFTSLAPSIMRAKS